MSVRICTPSVRKCTQQAGENRTLRINVPFLWVKNGRNKAKRNKKRFFGEMSDLGAKIAYK
jgi:hypothetical protein